MVKKKRSKGKMLVTCCLILSIILGICSTSFSAFAQSNTEESSVSQANEQQEESTETSSAVTEPTEAATIEATQPATEAAEAATEPTAEITWESTDAASEEATDPTEEITAEATEPTEGNSQTEPSVEETTDVEESTEAPSEDEPLTRISFMSVKGLDEVDNVTLRIDGIDQADKIKYPAGAVGDNVSAIEGLLDSSKNQAFRRAMVKIPNPDVPGEYTETEIARMGNFEGETYYSYGSNDDTGILLNPGEEIVLICESRHVISYSGFDAHMGTVTGKDLIWKDEALEISIEASDYYHISSVKVLWGNGTDQQEFVIEDNKKMTLSFLPYTINENGAFIINFEKDVPYTITAGQIQQGGICKDQGQEGDPYYDEGTEQPIPSVDAGDDVTFMLYSQSWTGGDEWYLNMMTINGENVFVPQSYEVGATSQKTVLSDGSEVTITLIAREVGLYWKEGDPFYGALGNFRWWSKERCLYNVTVTNVKRNLVVDANFKIGDNAEMIMTGLEGIEKVGAAVTDRRIGHNGYDYYYSLEIDEPDNVFPIYIRDKYNSMEGEQINFYVYSVSPGYNPYTVNIRFFSDGVEYPYSEKIFKGQNNTPNAGIPMDRIKIDENDPTGVGILQNYINSAYRKLIYEAEDDEGNTYTYNFYEDVYANGYTHAFGIKETLGNNSSDKSNGNNQMVILSASPYEYHLEFDLNGGTYEDTGLSYDDYIIEDDKIVERKDPYTIENGAVTVYMPLIEPVSNGQIFVGWQLVDENGTPVDNNIYNANQAYVIDEGTIGFSTGDEKLNEGHKFTFKAVWKDLIDEAGKTTYTIKYYKEVAQDTEGAVEINGKYYELYHSGVELATIGSSVVVLNYRHPEPQENYVLDETNSKLKIERIFASDEVGFEDNNSLLVLYNIKSYDLNITMTVEGDGNKNQSFQVTVMAFDSSGAGLTGQRGNVTFENGTATFFIKHGETVNIPGMDKDYTYEVVKDTDTEYKTSYKNNGVDVYENDLVTGTFEDENISVEIVKTRDLPVVTGVELGDNMAVGGFIIAAFAGIMLVVFSRRKKNV